MTADTKAFYAALGVELPAWLDLNASVRCFANPGAHQQEDRHPSCSVSILTGAWKCHGCGAHGGAYDAALARGHSPRSAIDLMIACGLTEPRQPAYSGGDRPVSRANTVSRPSTRAPRRLSANDIDICRWSSALDADNALVRRLMLERAWSPQALRELDVGFDGDRITVPIRDANGKLQGVLRYDPFGETQSEDARPSRHAARAHSQPGTRPTRPGCAGRGATRHDAARSAGIAAFAVPGDSIVACGVGSAASGTQGHRRHGLRHPPVETPLGRSPLISGRRQIRSPWSTSTRSGTTATTSPTAFVSAGPLSVNAADRDRSHGRLPCCSSTSAPARAACRRPRRHGDGTQPGGPVTQRRLTRRSAPQPSTSTISAAK